MPRRRNFKQCIEHDWGAINPMKNDVEETRHMLFNAVYVHTPPEEYCIVLKKGQHMTKEESINH